MNRSTRNRAANPALAVLLLCTMVRAQSTLSAWPHFVEVTWQTDSRGLPQLSLPAEVIGRARQDLADIRVYDVRDREVPYALLVRNELNEKRAIEATEFNRATPGPGATEVSLDLGEGAGEHNAVEITTPGTNYRRQVEISGGDDGRSWRVLKRDGVIFRLMADNREVAANEVSYPNSRYRYLRVLVNRDPLTEDKAPGIENVQVQAIVRRQGQFVNWPSVNLWNQPVRVYGEPGTAWLLDLGHALPCDRLIVSVYDNSFSRPYTVETVDDPQNPALVATGDLIQRRDEVQRPFTIVLNNEVYARKLKLTISDYSNPPLSINSIQAAAPDRQLVLAATSADVQPLRLYFGNPKATAPRYDFEKEVKARTVEQVVQVQAGSVQNNPVYVPEPEPLTERFPWLIYLVLGACSIVLAGLLVSLARGAIKSEAQSPPKANQN